MGHTVFPKSEFAKWHDRNPNLFHWTMKGGVITILSVAVQMPDKKDAIHLCNALRRRGVTVSYNYRRVFFEKCELGKLTDSLRAIKIDWDDFKTWVSYLYFKQDTGEHIPDYGMPADGTPMKSPA